MNDFVWGQVSIPSGVDPIEEFLRQGQEYLRLSQLQRLAERTVEQSPDDATEAEFIKSTAKVLECQNGKCRVRNNLQQLFPAVVKACVASGADPKVVRKAVFHAEASTERFSEYWMEADALLQTLIVCKRELTETESPANEKTVYGKLLSAYTHGTSDAKLKEMAGVILATGTIEEKTSKLHHALSMDALAAETIAELLSCSKQAVLKTSYWQKNRKGRLAAETETRAQRMKKRGNGYQDQHDND